MLWNQYIRDEIYKVILTKTQKIKENLIQTKNLLKSIYPLNIDIIANCDNLLNNIDKLQKLLQNIDKQEEQTDADK